MDSFRIDYRWRQDRTAFDAWSEAFKIVKAETEEAAVADFKSEFILSVQFQIISINGKMINSELQRRYRKKKADQEMKELRGVMLTSEEEKLIKPKIQKWLDELR